MAARTDNVTDSLLAADLLLARRGQASWARALATLSDVRFDEPSRVPGWSKRHLIANAGFRARAFARLAENARTGVVVPMYVSEGQRSEEIAFGSTLSVDALRNLCAHAAVHLNVEWRDLPEPAWDREVQLDDGRRVPISATVRIRAREIWSDAVRLDNGVLSADVPAELRDDLTPASI